MAGGEGKPAMTMTLVNDDEDAQPWSGGGDVASREDDSTSWRHTKRPVGEDVDVQQRQHNRPGVQAETSVGGGEGKPAVKT
uniref:Circumsporozoite protein-like n=1 Tax=Oryza sativa subsp. japonica TaxID=39947 RepID=Q6EQK2_ORYSJ|nr:circumsporozoite protein-like [Oryza sativa Japonica Group]BAD46706.1 circumsporozoite protein-like [Oryza sativa Japonica Group]